MNEYVNLILSNLDISYICSVMLIGYMFTKSNLMTKIKIKKRWLILIIGLLTSVFYYFVMKTNLNVLFFSFITAQFLNLYVAEYIIDFIINKLKNIAIKK